MRSFIAIVVVLLVVSVNVATAGPLTTAANFVEEKSSAAYAAAKSQVKRVTGTETLSEQLAREGKTAVKDAEKRLNKIWDGFTK